MSQKLGEALSVLTIDSHWLPCKWQDESKKNYFFTDRMTSPPSNPDSDRFKVEELEIENKKLREHLERIRGADATHISKEIVGEYLLPIYF